MARYIFTMYDAFYVNYISSPKITRHISTKMQIADDNGMKITILVKANVASTHFAESNHSCVTTFLAVAGNFITARGVQLIDNDNNNK